VGSDGFELATEVMTLDPVHPIIHQYTVGSSRVTI
jgi:hypothetical protein